MIVVLGSTGFGSAGQLARVPEAWSAKILAQPAAVSASVWACGCWSRVETRAYPSRAMPDNGSSTYLA